MPHIRPEINNHPCLFLLQQQFMVSTILCLIQQSPYIYTIIDHKSICTRMVYCQNTSNTCLRVDEAF
eukprot:UN01898